MDNDTGNSLKNFIKEYISVSQQSTGTKELSREQIEPMLQTPRMTPEEFSIRELISITSEKDYKSGTETPLESADAITKELFDRTSGFDLKSFTDYD